jgi:hypothetical protein
VSGIPRSVFARLPRLGRITTIIGQTGNRQKYVYRGVPGGGPALSCVFSPVFLQF